MNANTDKIANILETIGAYLGVALVIVSSIQHGIAHPLAGETGGAALASLVASFGLHHGQSNK